MLDGRAAALLRESFANFAAPPPVDPVTWASDNVRVPAGPLEGARWRPFAPQAGILAAFDEAGIEVVVLMTGTQVGKSLVGSGMVGWTIDQRPGPILMTTATDEAGEILADERIDPLIDRSPRLSKLVAPRRGGGGAGGRASTRMVRRFAGGLLQIASASTPTALASRSVRVLFMDEIDRVDVARLRKEGDPVKVGMARTATFGHRRIVLLASSPTVSDGPIDSWHARGDQRVFECPCPSCATRFVFAWETVKWTDDDPETARIQCPECRHDLSESERRGALAAGRWTPTAERAPGDRHIASFHAWAGQSPLHRLAETVADFLSARREQKRGDLRPMQSWRNTALGLPWQGAPLEVAPEGLLARRETYDAPMPTGAAVLTAGVDVQDSALIASVYGWGVGEEGWLVDHRIIPGDPIEAHPWATLDQWLLETWRTSSGRDVGVSAAFVDSGGHRTDNVYRFVRTRGRRRIWASKGRGGDGYALVEWSKTKAKTGSERRPYLALLAVDELKRLVQSGLQLRTPGARYLHLPADDDVCGEALIGELTAEREVTKRVRGRLVRVWEQLRDANHAFDCAVMALAALRAMRVRNMPDRIAALAAGGDAPKPKPKPRRSDWIGAGRDFLKR